jgi:hypothetical protein
MGGDGEIAALIWDEGFPGNSKSGCCINPFPCGDPMDSSLDQARPHFMLFSFRAVFRDSYVLWGISDWLAGFLNQTTQIQPDQLGQAQKPQTVYLYSRRAGPVHGSRLAACTEPESGSRLQKKRQP